MYIFLTELTFHIKTDDFLLRRSSFGSPLFIFRFFLAIILKLKIGCRILSDCLGILLDSLFWSQLGQPNDDHDC